VVVHGGPHWHALDRLQHLEAQVWAAEGWAVFLPNYRGSCGWGDAYGRASYRDLGGADFRDLLAGVEAVIARGAADPERMAITGGSYGGYLTSWALARSDRFRAGVSACGIYSLLADFDNSEWPAWERDYLGAYYWEDPTLYVERSVSTHVKELKAPLLLLHGEEDENTYITNSRALYRALREQGRETEMVVYPREEHGLREPSHRIDAFRRSLAWMERHVLGRGPATLALEAREVAHGERPGVLLRLVSAEASSELAGLRAEDGFCWLVVEGYLRAEAEVESLSLVPAGARPEVLVLDEEGRPHRPVGLPLEVLGQRMLLEGESGRLRAVRGKDGSPPSLAFAAVFSVPARAARWRLRVNGYPELPFDLAPPKDDEDEGGE
jgi:acetyl esterase/lipase